MGRSEETLISDQSQYSVKEIIVLVFVVSTFGGGLE